MNSQPDKRQELRDILNKTGGNFHFNLRNDLKAFSLVLHKGNENGSAILSVLYRMLGDKGLDAFIDWAVEKDGIFAHEQANAKPLTPELEDGIDDFRDFMAEQLRQQTSLTMSRRQSLRIMAVNLGSYFIGSKLADKFFKDNDHKVLLEIGSGTSSALFANWIQRCHTNLKHNYKINQILPSTEELALQASCFLQEYAYPEKRMAQDDPAALPAVELPPELNSPHMLRRRFGTPSNHPRGV